MRIIVKIFTVLIISIILAQNINYVFAETQKKEKSTDDKTKATKIELKINCVKITYNSITWKIELPEIKSLKNNKSYLMNVYEEEGTRGSYSLGNVSKYINTSGNYVFNRMRPDSKYTIEVTDNEDFYEVDTQKTKKDPKVITFDNSFDAKTSNLSKTLKWSHTVSSNLKNKMLIVNLSYERNPIQDEVVKCNGVPMKLAIREFANGEGFYTTAIYYLPNPSSGKNNITVEMSNYGNISARSISLSNVFQGKPEATYSTHTHYNDSEFKGADKVNTYHRYDYLINVSKKDILNSYYLASSAISASTVSPPYLSKGVAKQFSTLVNNSHGSTSGGILVNHDKYDDPITQQIYCSSNNFTISKSEPSPKLPNSAIVVVVFKEQF